MQLWDYLAWIWQKIAWLDVSRFVWPAIAHRPFGSRITINSTTYRVIDQIGEGGYSLIFLAAQQDAAAGSQKVAIKKARKGDACMHAALSTPRPLTHAGAGARPGAVDAR